MMEKIRYYLRTTAAQRASDRAEYNALVQQYEDQLGVVATAEAALHSPVMSAAKMSTSEKYCVMHTTLRMDDYLDASMNGYLPMMVEEKKCPFYRPRKNNGACWRGTCACSEKNRAFFAARDRQYVLSYALDSFWAKKYMRVK